MNDELPTDLTKKKLAQYKEDVTIYAENLMELAKTSSEVSEQLKYDSDAATAIALRVVKMNKAIDVLADNMEN